MKKRILSLFLAALLLVGLAACGGAPKTTPPPAGPLPTAAPVPTGPAGVLPNAPGKLGMYPGTSEAGMITVECSTMSVMNPILMTYATELAINRHIWDCLVKFDLENNVIGAAAESWTSSDDGLVWTFKLREGAKWVDTSGTVVADVTAHDFVFAWGELINPANAAEYVSFGMALKNAEAYYDYASGVAGAPEVKLEDVGVRAIDDYTLEVELENYIPYFLQYVKFEVMAPIYEPFYTQVGADKYGTSPETMLYSGPFRMTSWVPENRITTLKNDSWYEADKVSLAGIHWDKYSDQNARFNAFQGNELDITDIRGEDRIIMNQEGYPVSNYIGGYSFYYLANNTDKSDLRSPSLRQAISAAIDREQIIATVFKNDNEPAPSFALGISGVNTATFGDAVKAANGGQPLYAPKADVEKAKSFLPAALEELGYTNVSEIKISLLTSESTVNELMSQVVQEQIRVALGIEVGIDIATITDARARRNAKDYDLFMGGWGPDYDDPMTDLELWTTTNGNNHSGYSSAEYDALIEATKTELDLVKREQMFVECEMIIARDMPIIPVYWRHEDFLISEKVTGGVGRLPFQYYNLIYVTLG